MTVYLNCYFFGVFSLFLFSKAYPQNFPPVLEKSDFYKYEVESVTEEKLEICSDQDLSIYYYYYFDTKTRNVLNAPKWRDVVESHLVKKGEEVQDIVEGIYKSEKSLSVKYRVLEKLNTFPSLDKDPFIDYVFEEIDGYPEKIEAKFIVANRVLEKIEFVFMNGNEKDFERAMKFKMRNNLIDSTLERKIASAKERLYSGGARSKERSERADNASGNQLEEKSEDQVSGKSLWVWACVVIVLVLFILNSQKWLRKYRKV